MRKSLLPLLGIAFAVAILATAVFYGLFLSKFQSGSAAHQGPLVVVAARDLDRGTALKPTDVKVVNWGGAPVKGALSSPEQVAGLSLMGAVQENEPLTEARVASPDKRRGRGDRRRNARRLGACGGFQRRGGHAAPGSPGGRAGGGRPQQPASRKKSAYKPCCNAWRCWPSARNWKIPPEGSRDK